jgi:hypothetical protein
MIAASPFLSTAVRTKEERRKEGRRKGEGEDGGRRGRLNEDDRGFSLFSTASGTTSARGVVGEEDREEEREGGRGRKGEGGRRKEEGGLLVPAQPP